MDDVPHNLSDASLLPINPELLDHNDDMADIDPDLASATATVLANQVNFEDGDNGSHSNSLLDPTLADKWSDFAASSSEFYPQNLGSDAYAHDHGDETLDNSLDINQQNIHGDDGSSKAHFGLEGVEAGGVEGEVGGQMQEEGGDTQAGTPADASAEQTAPAAGNKRKRGRRDPSQAGPSSMRKRPSMPHDPNDPVAHLQLPPNLVGRPIEYATAPLEDTRHGPVFVHPTQTTVQACVRCHGIKRKCEALVWRLKSDAEGSGGVGGFGGAASGGNLFANPGMGGVIWDKPRCLGCEKADVPCVFELAAASSG